jgi:hypothetical protein
MNTQWQVKDPEIRASLDAFGLAEEWAAEMDALAERIRRNGHSKGGRAVIRRFDFADLIADALVIRARGADQAPGEEILRTRLAKERNSTRRRAWREAIAAFTRLSRPSHATRSPGTGA